MTIVAILYTLCNEIITLQVVNRGIFVVLFVTHDVVNNAHLSL